MKLLAVVESKHLGNTRKVAEAMAEAAPLTVTDLAHVSEYRLRDYDIVGFGSGIYGGAHDEDLIRFVSTLCDRPAYTFVFSTSGILKESYHKRLTDLLTKKNKTLLGTFSCKGWNRFFFFRLIGGTNKGHPDRADLEHAQQFMTEIIDKYRELEG